MFSSNINFSSINEAWSNDPVKEMTRKLNDGKFIKPPENIKAYKINGTDANEASLTENTINIDLDSDSMVNSKFPQESTDPFSSISSLSLDKMKPRKGKGKHKSGMKMNRTNKKKHWLDYSLDTSDGSDADGTDDQMEFESSPVDECNYSIKHLKKCGYCYRKLKKIIDRKVNERCNDFMRETNMKQSQMNQNQQPLPFTSMIPMNDSWKETLIIVCGAIIVIFILFLITKSLGR